MFPREEGILYMALDSRCNITSSLGLRLGYPENVRLASPQIM